MEVKMTVTMYSTPTCGYCTQAKNYLRKLGLNVKDIDITRNPRAAEEMVRRTGQQGVPVIIVKGATVLGFDRKKIDRILGVN